MHSDAPLINVTCSYAAYFPLSQSLQAAEAMKLTAHDLLKLKIIDEVIPEPLGGAHRDPESIAADIKQSIIKNLKVFESFGKHEIFEHRKAKFLQIGRDKGFSKSTNLSEGGLSYQDSKFENFKIHIDKNKYLYGGLGLVAKTFGIDDPKYMDGGKVNRIPDLSLLTPFGLPKLIPHLKNSFFPSGENLGAKVMPGKSPTTSCNPVSISKR